MKNYSHEHPGIPLDMLIGYPVLGGLRKYCNVELDAYDAAGIVAIIPNISLASVNDPELLEDVENVRRLVILVGSWLDNPTQPYPCQPSEFILAITSTDDLHQSGPFYQEILLLLSYAYRMNTLASTWMLRRAFRYVLRKLAFWKKATPN